MDQHSSPGWFRRRAQPDEIDGVRAELAAALDRADRAERELAAVRRAADEGPGGPDFGLRAEQILRLAESQARQTRTAATRDASALLERAHAEAETHRRRVAEELAARSAGLDRAAAERAAELDAREQQIDDLRRASIEETDRIRSAVLGAAEEVRRRAASEAAAQMEQLRKARAADGSDPGKLHLLDVVPGGDRDEPAPPG